MKVVAFVGSPRNAGNTELLTRIALEIIAESGIETELIRLFNFDIQPCTDCGVCELGETCSIDDDLISLYIKAKEANAIILASPVYFSSVTGKMKSFMERAGYISYRNGYTFSRKVGGPLTVAARNGGNFTNAQLLLWFMILGFVIPGSTNWNCAFGNEIGDIWSDNKGILTVCDFAENLAWLVKNLASRNSP